MSTTTATTVVRADVVGSLLRPEYLREIRGRCAGGNGRPRGAARGRGPRSARGDRAPGGRRDRGDHRRGVPAERMDRAHSDLRRPDLPSAGEWLRVPRRGVGLAGPLEDGRRREGRHVGATAAGAVRHTPPRGRPRHRHGRVRVPEGERARTHEVHDSGAELAPDLLAPGVLGRRIPDVGRLHPRRRPHPARARHRSAGRARLRLHPDRRAQLRAVAHRPRQPRRIRGSTGTTWRTSSSRTPSSTAWSSRV